jgi:hypothetical protein
MKERCYNPNSKYYHLYGGRGIKMCDKWKNSFEEFYNDMGKRPYRIYSIDRINNDGDYEPSNCRWATRFVQSRNKRTNRLVTFNDETKCVTDWANELEMPIGTLFSRLNSGWKVPDALTKPVRKQKHN